jgi:hypothetical protein
MDDAENDVLAFMTFPRAHWTQIYSTNLPERLNAEIKRRTNVVGIFPNRAEPCARGAQYGQHEQVDHPDAAEQISGRITTMLRPANASSTSSST